MNNISCIISEDYGDTPPSGSAERRRIGVVGIIAAIAGIIRGEQLEMMMKSLSCLDEEERFVIDGLFGLGKGGRKVLKEIGDALGKTAERVRQIKEKALGKMRSEMERMG